MRVFQGFDGHRNENEITGRQLGLEWLGGVT